MAIGATWNSFTMLVKLKDLLPAALIPEPMGGSRTGLGLKGRLSLLRRSCSSSPENSARSVFSCPKDEMSRIR
jgi:hypothetical protein